MRLPPLEVRTPRSVEEATAALEELGDDAALYCGGTELLLVAKLGFSAFGVLVDVKGIDELDGLSTDEGELRIGARVTHRQVEHSPLVRERWPALAAMERNVGNVRVRNVGTLAGNLCFADPHSDPAAYLLAAGGAVSARRGGRATRRIGVADLIRGPYQTALEPGELLTAIHVPQAPPGTALAHDKIAFHERPAATVAVRVTIRDGMIEQARVAVGSVGAVPVRATDAEQALAGTPRDALDGRLAVVGDAAARGSGAVADGNGSVQYKHQLVRVLTARCVRDAVARASSAY
jgi:carbon-monoxide dehydrogenase medium subunit